MLNRTGNEWVQTCRFFSGREFLILLVDETKDLRSVISFTSGLDRPELSHAIIYWIDTSSERKERFSFLLRF